VIKNINFFKKFDGRIEINFHTELNKPFMSSRRGQTPLASRQRYIA